MKAAAAEKIGELLEILGIDHRNDHNTRDTPTRVAKMFVEELLCGRFNEPPTITEFDNVGNTDQLIITGPIEMRSMCAHHMMPIYGSVYFGILPAADGKIIGLSKYDRIVHHFSARLQIQEELVRQIGAEREEIIKKAAREAEEFRVDLMAKARSDGEDIVRRAKEQITRESAVALAKLREEVADLAVLGASKIVASSMTPEAQKKLVADFVGSLPKAKN